MTEHESRRAKEGASRAGDEQAPSSPEKPADRAAPEDAQDMSARLERIEAALKLVSQHLHATTRTAQVLGGQQVRATLAAVVLGISATSILALWSITALFPALLINLLRLSLGMSLLLLASVIDLWSGTFLRKAANIAILEQDPSRIGAQPGPFRRFFHRSYWANMRQKSSDLFHYHMVRYSSLALYIAGVALLIWALVLLPR